MNLLFANVGVPMLFVQEQALILTLPVVIAIETWLCCKLYSTTLKQTLRASVVANLVSTFLGFPILWFFWIFVSNALRRLPFPSEEPWFSIYGVTVHAPWLPNDERSFWMVPTAMLVLLIPAFFVTVVIERRIYFYFLKDQLGGSNFSKESWIIHIASYSFLILAGVGLLVHSVMNHAVE